MAGAGLDCDIEDVFLAAGHVANGKLTVAELTEMSEHAVLGPGVCAGMGTANTMHLACEALGMALPGTTPVRANSEPMWRAVEQAAHRVVEMTAEDLRPRDILTPGAFANAVTAILSVSGSINSVKHLQAVAAEAECGADVYRMFEELAGRVPLLAAVRPNGEVPIEAFEDAGGARARDEAARAAAGDRRADRHRPHRRAEPGRRHRGRRGRHPPAGAGPRAPPHDRPDPRQPGPGRRHRQAGPPEPS